MGPCIMMLQHEVMVVDEWHNNGPQDLVTVYIGAFPLHGTARYGSLLGGFPLGTVPGTFLVPPQPRFQANCTVTKL